MGRTGSNRREDGTAGVHSITENRIGTDANLMLTDSTDRLTEHSTEMETIIETHSHGIETDKTTDIHSAERDCTTEINRIITTGIRSTHLLLFVHL